VVFSVGDEYTITDIYNEVNMSKHSHWDKVKRAKGAADRAKAIVGSKLLRLVSSAAKQGGGDPNMNFRLRLAVETAKGSGVTKDAIDRAIAKAVGAGADAEQLETLLYEAYGPGGVAILIECLASNRNKAVAEVKHTLTMGNGNMAGEGAVKWMFQHRGVLRFAKPQNDEFELKAIDAGADDVIFEDDGYTVYTNLDNLEKVKNALGETPEFAGFQWIPKDRIPVPEAEQGNLDALLESLDELEDVNEVYTNAE
jgi:YebC/PmpR family DNA-binding regulatory protein